MSGSHKFIRTKYRLRLPPKPLTCNKHREKRRQRYIMKRHQNIMKRHLNKLIIAQYLTTQPIQVKQDLNSIYSRRKVSAPSTISWKWTSKSSFYRATSKFRFHSLLPRTVSHTVIIKVNKRQRQQAPIRLKMT